MKFKKLNNGKQKIEYVCPYCGNPAYKKMKVCPFCKSKIPDGQVVEQKKHDK